MNPPPPPDLLIIGAGRLGAAVGALWRQRFPGARIVAETATARLHEALRAKGLVPRLVREGGTERFSHVLFCVPPSQSTDYLVDARRAVSLCDGGRAIFTSSTAVYAESHGGVVTESSEATASEGNAPTLLAAERVFLGGGGSVVRLAGLYSLERGPHRVYLSRAESAGRADAWLNLIHYDDAAALIVAALLRGSPSAIYLGADGHPITRGELARLAWKDRTALGLGDSAGPCSFTGREPGLGKRCDAGATCEALRWKPRWPGFAAWTKALGRRRVRSSVVCVHDDKLLLVLQQDPVTGRVYHFLPGGSIEPGESPAEAARREVLEETGYHVRVRSDSERVLHYEFLWSDYPVPCTTHFFAAQLAHDRRDAPTAAEPLLGTQWLALDEALDAMSYHEGIRDTVRQIVAAAHP